MVKASRPVHPEATGATHPRGLRALMALLAQPALVAQRALCAAQESLPYMQQWFKV
jgi:hypothetical protein